MTDIAEVIDNLTALRGAFHDEGEAIVNQAITLLQQLQRMEYVATVQLDSSGISDNPKFVRYFGAGWHTLPVGTKLYALKESSDD